MHSLVFHCAFLLFLANVIFKRLLLEISGVGSTGAQHVQPEYAEVRRTLGGQPGEQVQLPYANDRERPENDHLLITSEGATLR
jgi:hypothetical protein